MLLLFKYNIELNFLIPAFFLHNLSEHYSIHTRLDPNVKLKSNFPIGNYELYLKHIPAQIFIDNDPES